MRTLRKQPLPSFLLLLLLSTTLMAGCGQENIKDNDNTEMIASRKGFKGGDGGEEAEDLLGYGESVVDEVGEYIPDEAQDAVGEVNIKSVALSASIRSKIAAYDSSPLDTTLIIPAKPSITMSAGSLDTSKPSFPLPQFSGFEVGEIEVPELPSVELEVPEFEIPEGFTENILGNVLSAELPSYSLPDVQLPDAPALPGKEELRGEE